MPITNMVYTYFEKEKKLPIPGFLSRISKSLSIYPIGMHLKTWNGDLGEAETGKQAHWKEKAGGRAGRLGLGWGCLKKNGQDGNREEE